MRFRCYAQGKFYLIECPEGTRIVPTANPQDGEMADLDHLFVSLRGKAIRIPADPHELLPLLAETGNFGISLIGEPEPDVRLAGASCPGCGEVDVHWLRLKDEIEAVHCDQCGIEFRTSASTPSPATTSKAGG